MRLPWMRIGRWQSIVAIATYLAPCVVFDLFPHSGRPDFLYTGSIPRVSVWHFGWPLALFIYDHDVPSGIQVSPAAFLVPLAQIVVLLSAIGFVAVVRQMAGIVSRSKAT